MNVQKLESLPPPPGIIGSLRAGFDAVSNHVALILLPAVVDIFLWLGPHFSVDKLIAPFFGFLFEQAQNSLTSATDVKRYTDVQSMFNEVVQRYNLLSLISKLQTFPIGISSLTAKTMPVTTPLGSPDVVQVTSLPAMLGFAFLLILVGWVVGGLYYRWVSETTLGSQEARISSVRAIMQTLILCALWLAGLMMISIPTIFVISILTLISPTLASGALLVMAVLSFWLIVPLFFTPHGIFVSRQNALYSVYTSLRMARFTLPTSGLFVVCAFLLVNGLDYLWSVPPNNSWMTLVGIAGHAFITTALLSASFIYYRDMNAWLQTVFEQLQQKQGLPTRQA